MLAKILNAQLGDLVSQARQEDETHMAFVAVYPRTPKAYCPPTGQKTRELAEKLRSALDVAQCLERCWGCGDTRAGAELASFAEYLCAFSVAADIRRQVCWQGQGAKARVAAPRRPQEPREPMIRHIDLPEQVAAVLPPLPALYAHPTKARAGVAKVAQAVAALTARWGR